MAAERRAESRGLRPGRGRGVLSFLEQHRILRAAGIGVLSAAAALLMGTMGLLERAELATYDMRVRAMAPGGTSDLIEVVDYDQDTIELYHKWGRFGLWNRMVHKRLIEYIARGKPRLIVFDIIFSKGSSAEDEEFAEKCEELGNVVHSCVIFDSVLNDRAAERNYPLPPPAVIEKLSLEKRPWFTPDRNGATWPFRADPGRNLQVGLLANCLAVGSIHLEKGIDGVTRTVSPAVGHRGYLWPTLSMAAAMNHVGARPSFEPGELQLGEHRFPLDAEGRRHVFWYGPGNEEQGGLPARYPVTAAFRALLSESALRRKASRGTPLPKGFVDPGRFRDKIVLIHTGAAGSHDIRRTPFGNEPGVYIHAAALESLVRGDSVLRAGNWSAAMAAGFLALLVALAFPGQGWRAALRGTGAWVLLAGGYAGACYWAYSQMHVWLGLVVPQVSGGVSLATSLLAGYLVEGRRARRLRRGMSRFLSPEVLAEVADELDNLRPGMGKRHQVSMMFCDVRNFTTMSERLEPEAVMEILGIYLGAMTDVIMNNGGTLSKYLGDGIMAFWGAPLATPDHARRAARAALEMIATQEEVKRQLAEAGRPTFEIGIGLHAGDAVIGTVGSDRRLEYTAIGDTVNLASRVESLTKEFKVRICVTSDFARGLKDAYEFRELGSVTVKGRSAQVKILELREKESSEEAEA